MVFIPVDKQYELARSILDYLAEFGTDLTDNDLKWLIIFEDKLEDWGNLTERQMEVLKEIYARY